MAYALQDEKVRDVANHERLLKMLDRGIDDMEAGRELPLAEAFVKITELRNRKKIPKKKKPCKSMIYKASQELNAEDGTILLLLRIAKAVRTTYFRGFSMLCYFMKKYRLPHFCPIY